MFKESNKYNQALQTLVITLKSLNIYDFFIDDLITEITVNSDNTIFIKKVGIGWVKTNLISEPAKVISIIQILASIEGIVININNPSISTSIPVIIDSDSEKIKSFRFEGLIPPVVDNPIFSIRKPGIKIMELENYVKQGAFTITALELLKKYVKDKKNILIVGATDSGKTTLINALIREIDDERLIIVEETKELQIDKNKLTNVTFIQIIKGLFDGKAALRSCLRLAPQRIIFGEVRGEEAFDLLNMFNSGHEGGMCTIHANNCLDGLNKLETYVLYGQANANPKLIARTIDIVVHLKSIHNTRVLTKIAEVKGYKADYILEYKYELNEEKYREILKTNKKGGILNG